MDNWLVPMFGGIEIRDAETIGDAYEDWSDVRAPSRALRRRKLGHPQRVITRYSPNGKIIHDKARGIIYAHPVDRMKLEVEIRRRFLP